MTPRVARLNVAADPDEALRQALDLHRRRSFDAAERLYRSVLYAAPEHPDALHWLGVVMCATGRQEQGRALIERSIALVPSFPGFHNNYGNALLASGAFADAERAYRRCLDLDAKQPAVWCNLGICLRKACRPVEAVHAFEQALSVDVGDADGYRSLVDILEAAGKFQEVASAYEEALATLPSYEPAFEQLARGCTTGPAGSRTRRVSTGAGLLPTRRTRCRATCWPPAPARRYRRAPPTTWCG